MLPATAGRGRSRLLRLGLLALVAGGMTGCVALLGWLSVRVLLQGVLALVLLLGAPTMLFAPAFGDGRRRLFALWAKRLSRAEQESLGG